MNNEREGEIFGYLQNAGGCVSCVSTASFVFGDY